MKTKALSVIWIIFVILGLVASSHAGMLGHILHNVNKTSGTGVDNGTVVSGLKEALSTGTSNAVSLLAKTNGYFGNESVKILMPEKIQMVATALGKVGMQKQVDDFILSMNRAAEKSVTQAAPLFADAIKEMTFEDATKILNGGETSATDYFRDKTASKLYDKFKPVVEKSINSVDVTRRYNDMMKSYRSLPFAPQGISMDLNDYVTTKALDGLFYMVGQEEKKIRTDPAARVTDLLKTVFGQKG